MIHKLKNLHIGQTILISTLLVLTTVFTVTNSISINGGHLTGTEAAGLYTSITFDALAGVAFIYAIYMTLTKHKLENLTTVIIGAATVFALASGLIPLLSQQNAYFNYRDADYINDYVAAHLKENMYEKATSPDMIKILIGTGNLQAADAADQVKIAAAWGTLSQAQLDQLVALKQITPEQAEDILELKIIFTTIFNADAAGHPIPKDHAGALLAFTTAFTNIGLPNPDKLAESIFVKGTKVYKDLAPITVNLWPACLTFTILGGIGIAIGGGFSYIKKNN